MVTMGGNTLSNSRVYVTVSPPVPRAGRPLWCTPAARPCHPSLCPKTRPVDLSGLFTVVHKLLWVIMNFLSSPKFPRVRGSRSQARRFYHLQRQKLYFWPLRILKKLIFIKKRRVRGTSASHCGHTLIPPIYYTLKCLYPKVLTWPRNKHFTSDLKTSQGKFNDNWLLETYTKGFLKLV